MCLRGMRRQGRPRSDCRDVQSDLGLCCQLPESLYTIECINGERRSGLDLVHAQDDVNLEILCMLKGIFPLGAAQIIYILSLTTMYYLRPCDVYSKLRMKSHLHFQ